MAQDNLVLPKTISDTPTTTTGALRKPPSTLARVARYTLLRGLSLLAVVAVAVLITIFIASKSVVLDRDVDLLPPGSNPGPIEGWFAGISNPTFRVRTEGQPSSNSLQDSLYLLYGAMTLQLGNTRGIYFVSGYGFGTVREVILDTLPRTLLLFGTVNVLVFFTSIGLALVVSRRFGSRLDRLILGISPLSGVPPWLYGVAIGMFALYVLRIHTGGLLDRWPEEFSWQYAAHAARIMAPAVLALFLSKFFQSVVAWRSFLLVFSGEDYVELARAKGLPGSLIERRYLLRPVLPSLITTFAMLVITIWQEAIIVELFFGVGGIGHAFYNAIRYHDIALAIGLTVTFAYMLALSVFFLDIIYALVDPRIRIGQDSREGRVAEQTGRWRRLLQRSSGAPAAPAATRTARPAREPLRPMASIRRQASAARQGVERSMPAVRGLLRSPTAVAGLAFIALLGVASVYALAAIPRAEAVRQWNYANTEWSLNPVHALPEWVNIFRRDKLPSTILLGADAPGVTKTIAPLTDEITEVIWVFPFDYPYGGFPQEMVLNVQPAYQSKLPYATVELLRPDGEVIKVGDFTFNTSQAINISRVQGLSRRVGGQEPLVGLFANPESSGAARALPGRYELRVFGLVFEPESDIAADFQIYGQVHGLAGTDYRRRDMAVALLWGAPVALAVGLLGALGTTLLTVLVAALGAWFGGWVDGAVQRLTEVNMILPAFPILLIIYNFYTKSFWVIIGVVILLSIFGASVKSYRAMFLQVKESPYIEAARAYGAGDLRMIIKYLVPPIGALLIPQLVILIPTYVYLEATLAYLGMSDPLLPTWGKLIKDGLQNGGLTAASHAVALPTGVLLATGMAFLMVGYAFERILNPRLKEI